MRMSESLQVTKMSLENADILKAPDPNAVILNTMNAMSSMKK